MESLTAMDGILGGLALLILGGGIFMLLGSMYNLGDRM
jgi:hypothetical protein